MNCWSPRSSGRSSARGAQRDGSAIRPAHDDRVDLVALQHDARAERDQELLNDAERRGGVQRPGENDSPFVDPVVHALHPPDAVHVDRLHPIGAGGNLESPKRSHVERSHGAAGR